MIETLNNKLEELENLVEEYASLLKIFSKRKNKESLNETFEELRDNFDYYNNRLNLLKKEFEKKIILENEYKKLNSNFKIIEDKLKLNTEQLKVLEEEYKKKQFLEKEYKKLYDSYEEFKNSANSNIIKLKSTLETLDTKYQLTSQLLKERSKSIGLKEFKNALYNDFMDFANKESSVANEAELILKLQDIEKELELISAYPSLHSKNIVAVGGGFSSGKSQFISSFIEKDISLPIGVVPTTAIPTYVINDNKDKFLACNNKGGVVELQDIDKDIYKKLSHNFITSFNFNLKEIMPFMILSTKTPYENICFVDTPGYNPADSSNNYTSEDIKTSKEFLENSNGFLWLIGLDSNGTISSNDLEFLSSLNLEDKNLYIVLNKADLRPLSALEEIIETVADSLEDYDIEYIGISAFSSKLKKEFTYDKLSIFEFLENNNIETKKHKEIIDKIKNISNIYKDAIEKDIENKEKMKDELHSISIDIKQEGKVSSNDETYNRINILKQLLDSSEEKENLKQLNEVIKKLKNSISSVFYEKIA